MRLRSVWTIVALLAVAGCGEEKKAAAPPPPAALTAEAVGHYCNMTLIDHPGPKGQIFVAGRDQPYWFSSARDAIAFTLLPEEPKDIRAIYVTDMAKAKSWDDPGPQSWINAREAFYVLDSARRGGMGQQEAVPFSRRDAAEDFARANGGKVAAFADVPRDYVLGGEEEQPHPAGEGHR